MECLRKILTIGLQGGVYEALTLKTGGSAP
jgi:hypothetical protein